MDFPHNGPVTRKMFPFHDVMIFTNNLQGYLKCLWRNSKKYMGKYMIQSPKNLAMQLKLNNTQGTC